MFKGIVLLLVILCIGCSSNNVVGLDTPKEARINCENEITITNTQCDSLVICPYDSVARNSITLLLGEEITCYGYTKLLVHCYTPTPKTKTVYDPHTGKDFVVKQNAIIFYAINRDTVITL